MPLSFNPCSNTFYDQIVLYNRYFVVSILLLEIFVIFLLRVCTIIHQNSEENIIQNIVQEKKKKIHTIHIQDIQHIHQHQDSNVYLKNKNQLRCQPIACFKETNILKTKNQESEQQKEESEMESESADTETSKAQRIEEKSMKDVYIIEVKHFKLTLSETTNLVNVFLGHHFISSAAVVINFPFTYSSLCILTQFIAFLVFISKNICYDESDPQIKQLGKKRSKMNTFLWGMMGFGNLILICLCIYGINTSFSFQNPHECANSQE